MKRKPQLIIIINICKNVRVEDKRWSFTVGLEMKWLQKKYARGQMIVGIVSTWLIRKLILLEIDQSKKMMSNLNEKQSI